MSLLKYIERVKHMDNLIRRKATGSAEEFAQKLGISTTQFYEDLKEMRELGAPIIFCSVRKSYQYEGDFQFVLKFEKSRKIKGGKNFSHSGNTGVSAFTFEPQALLDLSRMLKSE